MREIKNKSYWSLFSLLMVVVMIVVGYFVIYPYVGELNEINTSVDAKEIENNELEQKLSSLEKLKTDFESNTETVKMLDLALPESDMLAEIVETIQDIAGKSALQIDSIKQTKSKDDSNTIISVGFEGSYTSFKLFLDDLEQNIRLVTPTKITLSETKNTEDGESFLKGTIELDFFKVNSTLSSNPITTSSTTSTSQSSEVTQ